eukprot:TRINITY_DN3790_c0_g1_i1.p1 TRINITY_DN3790_c0_g1~~TRINITY_DN3790_c0_g1_i1.p1  ORF type:complete len:272 (-),score=43.57 TRINITY_DN3790_c0_g1_i1:231-1046(-)
MKAVLLVLFCLIVVSECSFRGYSRLGSNSYSRRTDRLFHLTASNRSAVVNVYDFGAKGDGKADDTAAFQAALNSLANSGGTVFAADGTFKFNGHLTVPVGVTLEGTFTSVSSHPIVQDPNQLNIGTILLPYEGRNNENGIPFITLKQDSALKGVVIYYPELGPKVLPVPYPWTIDMTGNNPAVIDVECLNCWNAIRAVGAARHYIARVQGQPINTGILIDETYDIGRVEDVHFNPWFSDDPQFVKWQLLHGRAFVIARRVMQRSAGLQPWS